MQFIKLRVFKVTYNILPFLCVETNLQYHLAFILIAWIVSKYGVLSGPYLDTSYTVTLTHFSPVSHFYTPRKRQKNFVFLYLLKTFGFLTFLGGIEMWHWTKMGWVNLSEIFNLCSFGSFLTSNKLFIRGCSTETKFSKKCSSYLQNSVLCDKSILYLPFYLS